jgi:hypothetical protein
LLKTMNLLRALLNGELVSNHSYNSLLVRVHNPIFLLENTGILVNVRSLFSLYRRTTRMCHTSTKQSKNSKSVAQSWYWKNRDHILSVYGLYKPIVVGRKGVGLLYRNCRSRYFRS